MTEATQETRQIISELKAILQDALAILDGKDRPVNRDIIRNA